jgi:hypothetical protein
MVLLLTAMAFLQVNLRLAVVILFFVACWRCWCRRWSSSPTCLLSLRALRTEMGDAWGG